MSQKMGDRSWPLAQLQKLRRSRPVLLWGTYAGMLALLMLADPWGQAVAQPGVKSGTETVTPLVGDHTTYGGLAPLAIRGVGLVVGLNGTGGDPQPSGALTELREDLKRREVKEIDRLLRSPDTAMVEVVAYLTPLMDKGDTIDVELMAPEESEAKSLEGGWLMECFLTEQAFVPGRGSLKGHIYARAKGPVITRGVNLQKKDAAENLYGRVLGGAIVTRERELSLELRNDFRNIRNSKRVADSIGRRFHDFEAGGIQRSLAEAKTDQQIVLKVHPKYKDNYPHYLQVVRHIAFREDAVGRRIRMQKLQQELMVPETAEKASLQLEAIGNEALPILRAGLKAPTLESRFYAGIAAAYLGERDAVPVLAECAKQERAFRVFALSAMSSLDDADVPLALRELMNDPTPETRYGAFRALWTLDKKDPFLNTDGLRPDERGKPEYFLHSLDTEGEPMAHATLRRRPEIVLFGRTQEFKTPLYLQAGRNIIITARTGDTYATLARFEVGKPEQKRKTSLRVADVIHAAADLGAHYPDIVGMLVQADRQHNLAGEFALDALPAGGRVYRRPETPGLTTFIKESRVGRDALAPNAFSNPDGEVNDEPTTSPEGQGVGNVPPKMSEKPEREPTEFKRPEEPNSLFELLPKPKFGSKKR